MLAFDDEDDEEERDKEVGCVEVKGAKGAKVLGVVIETGGVFGG